MFEIGFPELILIAIVGLLVIGPERLPEALRTLGLWVGRMRRSFTNVKNEIEKEIGMDEVRRQLHNEAVMEEMKRIERDVRSSVDNVSGERAADTPPAAGSSGEPAGTQPAADHRAPGNGSPDDYSPEPHPDTAAPPSPSGAGEHDEAGGGTRTPGSASSEDDHQRG